MIEADLRDNDFAVSSLSFVLTEGMTGLNCVPDIVEVIIKKKAS